MEVIPVTASEATAAQRRVSFFLRLSADGVSPALGLTGQPQISTNGAAWNDTGIAVLTEVGNGEYFADLTSAAVANAGDKIKTRFQDVNGVCIETRGDTFLVVACDFYNAVNLGLSGLANLDVAVSTRAVAGDAMTLTSGERTAVANALLDLAAGVETGLTLRQAQRLALAALAGKISGAAGATVTIRNAVADTVDRIVATVDSSGNRSAIVVDLS